MRERRNYSNALKAKIVLEVLSGQKTMAEIASAHSVHPNQISKWKKQVLEGLPDIFSVNEAERYRQQTQEQLIAQLYQQIGQLKVELDWLKKNLNLSIEQKRMSIDMNNTMIPIWKQCELLGLNRSTLYYKPAAISEYNLMLLRLLDEQYTRTPFYGIRKMTKWLNRRGYSVNHKRVRRLMRVMGLQAIHPKPWLSKKDDNHKIYPYLLNGVDIKSSNQVWASDITYIRMREGFIYLVAVMDWYSRYVLSWAISISLDTAFCIEALERALEKGRPEIFNTDQGSQFTSKDFTDELLTRSVRISMDGRGRVFDNIFIERLWRSLKYEEVYLKEYATVTEAVENITHYFHFYNEERIHQSLDYKTPQEVYYGMSKIKEKGGYALAGFTP